MTLRDDLKVVPVDPDGDAVEEGHANPFFGATSTCRDYSPLAGIGAQ